MTEPTYEVPFATVEIPVPCGPTTVASFTFTEIERPGGWMDIEIAVMRSCGHGPYYTPMQPVIGSPAMTCLGPQVETLPSGRADKSLPPMRKGRRWIRMPEKVS